MANWKYWRKGKSYEKVTNKINGEKAGDRTLARLSDYTAPPASLVSSTLVCSNPLLRHRARVSRLSLSYTSEKSRARDCCDIRIRGTNEDPRRIISVFIRASRSWASIDYHPLAGLSLQKTARCPKQTPISLTCCSNILQTILHYLLPFRSANGYVAGVY